MELKKLNNSIGVSAQISVDDVALVKELGYALIVCHRPDGEGADQVNFEQIEQVAKQLNLQAIYQPVVSGKISDADVATFKNILLEAKGPVFAYCRTGTRCTTLWSLTQAGELSVNEILSTAKSAGYDMSGIADRILSSGVTTRNKID